jgi:hypothetical protein
MGYRSDVHMAFYTTKEEEWGAVKLWVQENIVPHIEGEKCEEFTHGGGPVGRPAARGFYIMLEDWKYNDVYEAVDKINEAFDQFCALDTEDTGYACEFIRIGEEDDDIERMCSGNPEGFLYITRTVHTEF